MTSIRTNKGGPKVAYEDIYVKQGGLITESFSRLLMKAVDDPDSGVINYMIVPFQAGDIVNNIVVYAGTAGVDVTLMRAGIYTTGGVLVAQTDDVKTLFSGPGSINALVEMPLTAAYTIPANSLFYLAMLSVASTSTVSLGLAPVAVAATMLHALGGASRVAAAETGAADLPAEATFGNASTPLWIAAS